MVAKVVTQKPVIPVMNFFLTKSVTKKVPNTGWVGEKAINFAEASTTLRVENGRSIQFLKRFVFRTTIKRRMNGAVTVIMRKKS